MSKTMKHSVAYHIKKVDNIPNNNGFVYRNKIYKVIDRDNDSAPKGATLDYLNVNKVPVLCVGELIDGTPEFLSSVSPNSFELFDAKLEVQYISGVK